MSSTVDPNLADSMGGLMRAIRREYRRRLRDLDLDLTPLEIQAIEFLERMPGACLYHLVDETVRDKAQVTRAMKALEEKGLVERQRDPADQRCVRLYLSGAGRGTRATLREIRGEIEARLFSALEGDEQQQLAVLIRRCLASLQGGPDAAAEGGGAGRGADRR